MTRTAPATGTPLVHRLANGVRVLVLREPAWPTSSISVFVRSGSAHEPRALSGISHVVEHMAFKGTRSRNARQLNLDAERLGAEVNAHTDKDHTAFQMRGLAHDAAHFVEQLGDIVLHSTFPADELERERQVLLHEFADDEDDPMSQAYKLFDHACFGLHPAAQPVIGTRRNVERFSREDLLQYVERQYSGCNVVVAAAGNIDAERVLRAAETAFAALRPGQPNVVEPPAWGGGVRSRRHGDTGQVHLVLGFAVPGLSDDPLPEVLAAAVFGEGMSSPLLHRLREQRALAYHATCAADVMDGWGQFVVEVSTAPAQLEEVAHEVATLLQAQARGVDPQDLERARHQLLVRRLQDHERALKRLEDAALDLFVHDRLRELAQWQARLRAVTADEVRRAFESMIGRGVAAAAVGPVPRAAGERLRVALAPLAP